MANDEYPRFDKLVVIKLLKFDNKSIISFSTLIDIMINGKTNPKKKYKYNQMISHKDFFFYNIDTLTNFFLELRVN